MVKRRPSTRRRLFAAPTAALLFPLSLQLRAASSYQPPSPLASANAPRRAAASTAPRLASMIAPRRAAASLRSAFRSQRAFSSRLYGANTAAAQDVVELKYTEFLPPSTDASSNTPVIFLHGLLGNKRNFASLASSLSTQLRDPRPIYALDLRNHGENTHDWRPSMSYSEMARDVLAFMDRLDAAGEGRGQKAVLVGHSMGGKVAQSLALMHPDRVEGLVVLDIAPVRYRSDPEGKGGGGGGRDSNGGVNNDSGWKAVEDIVRSVAQIDLDRGDYNTKRDVDAALRRGPLEDPALRAFVLTNLEQRRTPGAGEAPLRWKINWDGIVRELDGIAGFDVHDRAADDGAVDTGLTGGPPRLRYDGDVFFIHGGASRFVRHSHIATIASFFPNHMLTTIRGVGHWVHAEAPDDTIALLKRYLDR